MKPKKFEGKLVLNKKTIANLESDEMNVAHGGMKYTYQQACTDECTETDCIWTTPVWCGSDPLCTGPFCI
jgi:hypothetical protein